MAVVLKYTILLILDLAVELSCHMISSAWNLWPTEVRSPIAHMAQHHTLLVLADTGWFCAFPQILQHADVVVEEEGRHTVAVTGQRRASLLRVVLT